MVKKKVGLGLICLLICSAIVFFSAYKADTASADGLTVSLMSDTEVMDDSVTVQSGLGLGINVLTAESLNDFKIGNNIFDLDKIGALPKSMVTLNASNSSVYSSTDINSYLLHFSKDYDANASAEVFLKYMDIKLRTSTAINVENYNYKYYRTFEHNINRYRLSLNNYLQKNIYAGCFNTWFLNDLANLKNTSNFTQFFNKYGTHIAGSAIYGGRLSANYFAVSNKVAMTTDYKIYLDSNFSNNNFVVSNTDIYNSIESHIAGNYTANDIQTGFFVNSQGGSAYTSSNMNAFETGYNNWCNSFENSDNSVIVDYDIGGLVPIWDVLPDAYSSVAMAMENQYIADYAESYSQMIEDFRTGDYENFSGGTGLIADPYIITQPNQMLNIAPVSLDAAYKLGNSISLSGIPQWNPIGGSHKENVFNGTFDGNGYTISNLSRTNDLTEDANNRFYFGLFGNVGTNGVLKNIKFTNVAVSMNGPERDDSQVRVFLGVAAGYLEGTAQNIEVASGSFSYDVCTNGVSYVGGIAGLAHNAVIKNCTNKINLTSGRFTSAVGGIAGYAYGTVFTNCTNSGALLSKCTGWGGYAKAGGIVGEGSTQAANTYASCSSSGTLTTKYYSWGAGHKFNKGEIEAAATNSNYQ